MQSSCRDVQRHFDIPFRPIGVYKSTLMSGSNHRGSNDLLLALLITLVSIDIVETLRSIHLHFCHSSATHSCSMSPSVLLLAIVHGQKLDNDASLSDRYVGLDRTNSQQLRLDSARSISSFIRTNLLCPKNEIVITKGQSGGTTTTSARDHTKRTDSRRRL